MSSADKRYHVIISERAGEIPVQHARFLAQVSPQAADKLRMDIIEAAKSLQKFPERGSWLTDPLLPANNKRLWRFGDHEHGNLQPGNGQGRFI